MTGWTDGKVRAFTPQTGKLLYIVQQAHIVKNPTGTPLPATTENYNVPTGVIALATSRSSNGIITGGYDCQVNIWHIGKQSQVLINSQKVHKTPVSAVKYLDNDNKAASVSIDGHLILWDLKASKQ